MRSALAVLSVIVLVIHGVVFYNQFFARWQEYQSDYFAKAIAEPGTSDLVKETLRNRRPAIEQTIVRSFGTERVDLIYDMLQRLAVDPAKILHASQRFVYHQPMYVGDRLTGTKRIANIADRKNGALTFIDTVIEYRNAAGEPVCEDHCSLVARNT